MEVPPLPSIAQAPEVAAVIERIATEQQAKIAAWVYESHVGWFRPCTSPLARCLPVAGRWIGYRSWGRLGRCCWRGQWGLREGCWASGVTRRPWMSSLGSVMLSPERSGSTSSIAGTILCPTAKDEQLYAMCKTRRVVWAHVGRFNTLKILMFLELINYI